MIIEDQDAFKIWLTAVLKPICEADPEALAKYVIALVKKDKSPDALHQSMVNQLQVFLQDETKPFVDQLFRTLESHEYIAAPTIPNANPPNPAQLTKAELPTKAAVSKPIIPVAEIAALSETLNGKGISPTTTTTTTAPPPAAATMTAVETKKEAINVEAARKDESKPRRRSRRRSLSRNRSRSRSWDRSARRSRSRDRGDKRRASWRNKSPAWRDDRRWSGSPPPVGGGRAGRSARSRSPRHGYRGGRYRNRSPPPRSHSRSRSHSPEVVAKPVEAPVAVDDQEKTPTHPVPPPLVDPAVRKRRCRDYDEEGYCMRGGMCPYDHGVDAVVLEDTALSRVLYPNGNNDSILGPPPNVPPHMIHPRPPEYNPTAPQMWHQRGPGGFRGGHRGGGMNQGPPRMPFPPPPNMPAMQQQRELIAVPVMGGGGGGPPDMPPMMDKYAFNPQLQPPPTGGYHPDGGGNFKKKQFDFNRLGPRQKNPHNCSLELKKIPTGMNNITHLNNHFAKFGKIVNIQVSFEGDPEAAIVTFSSHAEANAAYRSTEAVLNNRFIKVFWHAGGNNNNSINDAGKELPQARSVKERLGQHGGVLPNANKFLNLHKMDLEKENTNQTNQTDVEDVAAKEERAKELESKREELKAQQTLALKRKQELMAAKEKLKRNQEEKRKETLKMTQDLRKRKQDLLEKQIAQQKLLIMKMDKCSPGPQRDLLMQTIKKSHESIDTIRKDLAAAVAALKTSGPSATSSPVAVLKAVQKELLDTELDLISKQAEGVDTTDLQKKIWDLKARASSGGGGPVAVRGRGRGARRFSPLVGRHKLVKNNLVGEGKTTPPAAHAIDHRPTRLLVSGYETDEQENVLAHFRQFGEIADYESDALLPSVVLNYKTRKEAEIAFNKGKHFQDRTLSITWHVQAAGVLQRQPSRTVLISESDDDQLMEQLGAAAVITVPDDDIGPDLSEEVLLQDDEEEEEESEDRSWRR